MRCLSHFIYLKRLFLISVCSPIKLSKLFQKYHGATIASSGSTVVAPQYFFRKVHFICLLFFSNRNKDFQEVTLEKDGQVLLRFAAVYGFRNIQNLVQKLKRGKSPYHFVEVMACPSGRKLHL